MEWHNILLLILMAVIVVLYLYKRFTGMDLLKTIVMSKPVLVAQKSVINALYDVVPNETLRIIKLALNAGVEATELAEKAWLMGNLAKDERNPYAKQLAKEMLETIGIEVNEKIEVIIAGVIEMACMVLPHGVEPQPQEQEVALAV